MKLTNQICYVWFSHVATAQGFLLVRGETEVSAVSDTGVKQKHSFNVKVPSNYDKTDATAASLPISSAVVSLVTSCLSVLSSFVAHKGSHRCFLVSSQLKRSWLVQFYDWLIKKRVFFGVGIMKKRVLRIEIQLPYEVNIICEWIYLAIDVKAQLSVPRGEIKNWDRLGGF